MPKSVVKGSDLIRDDEDDEPIHYFMYILPRIKRKAAAACFCNGSLPEGSDYKDFACYEFTQNAGETVFIPNGWWHAVLNLTHTVGITQNFCSSRNFDEVWLKTRSGRKRLAWKWLCQLEIRYPHLANRAKAMNTRDKFVMKYDPYVQKMMKPVEDERRLYYDDDDDSLERKSENGGEGDNNEEDGDSHDTPPTEHSTPSVAAAAAAAPVRPLYMPSPTPQLSYLDRSWKRSRITDVQAPPKPIAQQPQQPQGRPVSPP